MTLLGHRAGNHPQQVATRGARDDVDDRRTPPDLLAECAAIAGVDRFTLDVAAVAANTVAVWGARPANAERQAGHRRGVHR